MKVKVRAVFHADKIYATSCYVRKYGNEYLELAYCLVPNLKGIGYRKRILFAL